MSESNEIVLVVGARPNFMKIAPLHAELSSRDADVLLVHTGQHYDEKMSKVFFEDLGMPQPDIYLGIGSGTHAVQTAKVLIAFEEICIERKPAMVVVVGDVNSTLACSIVASKLHIPCAHIEAGLRSFDRTMPEEINRLVTDAITDILLTPSKDGDENLLSEGVQPEKIHRVGNIMIDSLLNNLERSKETNIVSKMGLTPQKYVLITLHRPSNVDVKETFEGLVSVIEQISGELDFVFPMHPRTLKQAKKFALYQRLCEIPGMKIIEPLGYLQFISLMSSASFVMTDSGGLQEETTALGIPCITLRENTERPITITEGTNELAGTVPEHILKIANDIIDNGGKKGRIPDLWDGRTAHRIANIIEEYLENRV